MKWLFGISLWGNKGLNSYLGLEGAVECGLGGFRLGSNRVGGGKRTLWGTWDVWDVCSGGVTDDGLRWVMDANISIESSCQQGSCTRNIQVKSNDCRTWFNSIDKYVKSLPWRLELTTFWMQINHATNVVSSLHDGTCCVDIWHAVTVEVCGFCLTGMHRLQPGCQNLWSHCYMTSTT